MDPCMHQICVRMYNTTTERHIFNLISSSICEKGNSQAYKEQFCLLSITRQLLGSFGGCKRRNLKSLYI